MGLSTQDIKTMDDLFVHQLQDVCLGPCFALI